MNNQIPKLRACITTTPLKLLYESPCRNIITSHHTITGAAAPRSLSRRQARPFQGRAVHPRGGSSRQVGSVGHQQVSAPLRLGDLAEADQRQHGRFESIAFNSSFQNKNVLEILKAT